MNSMAVGVDIAKSVFQVHYIDQATGEIVNKQIKRAKFLEHFANRAPCLIGMEACGGAHHWARQLTKMGHQVRLMPAEFVKAFQSGGAGTRWAWSRAGSVLLAASMRGLVSSAAFARTCDPTRAACPASGDAPPCAGSGGVRFPECVHA
ncbi:hypothetical protein LMG26411_07827 [Cupriavidus numazuensis]|uniref:Transposase n=1 Tax=Cupriavidus numazuensis TaxID=221992 RepID=A0ABN7QBA1_9BURK|nr:hypothetical protein LMG26411_07827 [Cupriavidus numazuensis]